MKPDRIELIRAAAGRISAARIRCALENPSIRAIALVVNAAGGAVTDASALAARREREPYLKTGHGLHTAVPNWNFRMVPK